MKRTLRRVSPSRPTTTYPSIQVKTGHKIVVQFALIKNTPFPLHTNTHQQSQIVYFFCFSPNYTNKSETVQDTINGRWRQEVCTCRSGIPSQAPPFCPPTGRLTAWATTRGDMPAQRGAHLPHSPSLSASKSKPIKAETQNSSPHLKMHKPCKRERFQ